MWGESVRGVNDDQRVGGGPRPASAERPRKTSRLNLRGIFSFPAACGQRASVKQDISSTFSFPSAGNAQPVAACLPLRRFHITGLACWCKRSVQPSPAKPVTAT